MTPASLLCLLIQGYLKAPVLESAGAKANGTTTKQDFMRIKGRTKADFREMVQALFCFVFVVVFRFCDYWLEKSRSSRLKRP